MRIEIESNDLLAIADEIEHNCTMLGYTDGEDAEDDLSFYVPVIREQAQRLRTLAAHKEKQTDEKATAEEAQTDANRIVYRICRSFVNEEQDFRKG